MQIFLSYFYTVRFFKPYMIPFSTAMWDPKWYHAGQDQNYVFTDKKGVINGMRAVPLVPDKHCDGLCRGPDLCQDNKDPEKCRFLKAYSQQLEAIPVHNFVGALETISKRLLEVTHIQKDPVAVILVHEAPDNPCSERWPLLKWLNDSGYPTAELDIHNLP